MELDSVQVFLIRKVDRLKKISNTLIFSGLDMPGASLVLATADAVYTIRQDQLRYSHLIIYTNLESALTFSGSFLSFSVPVACR